MITVQGVTHTYREEDPISFPDFSCDRGDQLLILGASGSGKTTLLNLIGGLLKLQKGQITIGGKALDKLSVSELDTFRGQHIGMVFQKPHFVGSLSVLENITLAQSLAAKPVDKERAMQLLTRLKIDKLALKKPDQLSVGEQQRATIARALVNKPAIVLADEPTSALDDINCDEVVSLLENAASQEGSALLIVTHDQRLKDKFKNFVELTPQ